MFGFTFKTNLCEEPSVEDCLLFQGKLARSGLEFYVRLSDIERGTAGVKLSLLPFVIGKESEITDSFLVEVLLAFEFSERKVTDFQVFCFEFNGAMILG